jgi:hypothetical protein
MMISAEVEVAMVRARSVLTGVAIFLALLVGVGSFFFNP